jgi:hypothetical protein
MHQYSESNVMHILSNLLRINGLYMFRALLAYRQEAIHKRYLLWYIACVLYHLAAPGLKLNFNPGALRWFHCTDVICTVNKILRINVVNKISLITKYYLYMLECKLPVIYTYWKLVRLSDIARRLTLLTLLNLYQKFVNIS